VVRRGPVLAEAARRQLDLLRIPVVRDQAVAAVLDDVPERDRKRRGMADRPVDIDGRTEDPIELRHLRRRGIRGNLKAIASLRVALNIDLRGGRE
jgi:hypothetical protein